MVWIYSDLLFIWYIFLSILVCHTIFVSVFDGGKASLAEGLSTKFWNSRDKTLSNKAFYLMYMVSFSGALLIAVLIRVSTTGTGYDTEKYADFDVDFDYFWRDENGRAPMFIGSHMVFFNSLILC